MHELLHCRTYFALVLPLRSRTEIFLLRMRNRAISFLYKNSRQCRVLLKRHVVNGCCSWMVASLPNGRRGKASKRGTNGTQDQTGRIPAGGGQHIASWRHPDQPVDGAVSFEFHKQLAQTAERGLFDAYFLADNLAVGFGGAREGGNARVAGFEPTTLFSALAPFTTNLGFIAPRPRPMRSPI